MTSSVLDSATRVLRDRFCCDLSLYFVIVGCDCGLWLWIVIVGCDCALWLRPVIAACDCGLWLWPVIVGCDCVLWLFVIVGCDCELWLRAVVLACDCGLWSRPVIVGCDCGLWLWILIVCCDCEMRLRAVFFSCDSYCSSVLSIVWLCVVSLDNLIVSQNQTVSRTVWLISSWSIRLSVPSLKLASSKNAISLSIQIAGSHWFPPVTLLLQRAFHQLYSC
jgi:hypothetical protein